MTESPNRSDAASEPTQPRSAVRTLAAAWRGATSGSVSVMVALALPLLIALVALVAEYGYGLHCKAEDQRIADLAAYAGAVAYGSTNSTSTMNAVIANVAVLNGVASTSVSGSLVSSPTGDGNQAVLVNVNTTAPLVLAQIFGASATLPVAASAYAELKANSLGCIIALDGRAAGVALSGGTAVKAPTCAVASNAAVSAPCGTSLTTTQIDYNSSSPPSAPCGGIVAPSGQTLRITKTVTADPLAANSGVLAAKAHIASVAGLTSPAGPGVTGGVAVDFGYSTSSTQAQLAADGCAGVYAANTWTVTCAGAGPFHFGAITTGGGISVNFNTGGSASAVYDFSGYIYNTGSAMAFGPGTFNINQGVVTGGGTTTTFGAGTFNIGRGSGGCNGSSGYSICHGGALLAFNGPSTFVTQGGVYNGGGGRLVLGAGSSNSFDIGAANDGDAFAAAGGATTTFADAIGPGDVFEMAGDIDIVSGGGSCLTLSAAAQHDINGNLATAGATLLGAGVYTVNGYIGLGVNGGGDVTCAGADLGMSGTGVTLVTSGAHLIPGGTCSGLSFCIAAGFDSVTLTAPSSGKTANLVVVGPTSGSLGGAGFAEGARNTSLSGALYFPTGPITLSGGASVGNGSGQCLELIGSQITLLGGAVLASSCFSGGASSSGVVLVQ
jgi:Flp pilus assembly protein TadG